MIKCVSERFEINIRRVHVSIKFRARVVGDITGSDCYRLDPALATRICDVDCIFGKNHWIIISERNRPAPESLRCKRNLFRDAASASLSHSRALEMSQFWQNRQPRLHPAVPNDSTLVPGRKWFSGFFSIGSTQNPLLRP